MKQHTIASSCTFEGVGLHSGKAVEMRLLPAPDNYGIVFHRTDLGEEVFVHPRVENVVKTRRCTEFAEGSARIRTAEHLLAALRGLGVDNVLVQLNAAEVPILDGSALPYVTAIRRSGLLAQKEDRRYRVVNRHAEFCDPKSGSRIEVDPCDGLAVDLTIDFKSPMVGLQKASFDGTIDFATQIAPCRTFCFHREIALLRFFGLIKGGSLDNALVIDERRKQFMGGKTLQFDNELARHKLLDLLGDFALAGLPVRGRITAYKPGHAINTKALQSFIADSVL
ncbi:MAG: UDP-3-O-[Bacteroidales bacterium]|nr:UDP-3-O-[3-hydroxymyristoyl] N-acetylglucosamine deacetylase [Bacteroidales bacterium]